MSSGWIFSGSIFPGTGIRTPEGEHCMNLELLRDMAVLYGPQVGTHTVCDVVG